MSLSARPYPITTHGKTTNIYLLVTFRTDSWRRLWGDAVRSHFWSSVGPSFHRLRHGRLKAIQFALARWSFPRSHLLGCGFLPSSSHPRPSSSEAWTSSPTGSACFAFGRRHLSRRPLEEERPPSAPGHPAVSTTRRLCFAPSPRWAQTPL